jgi:hypothetical protein
MATTENHSQSQQSFLQRNFNRDLRFPIQKITDCTPGTPRCFNEMADPFQNAVSTMARYFFLMNKTIDRKMTEIKTKTPIASRINVNYIQYP